LICVKVHARVEAEPCGIPQAEYSTMFPRRALLPALCAGLVAGPLLAAEPGSGPETRPLSFEWNLRARQETVDDDAFAKDAQATTLRLRAGLRLRLEHGFGALVEGEGIAASGDAYNSGANGVTDRPAITDPEGAELNQAWIGWKGKRAGATAGRQRLQFDNQRWIGNSGWRQNEQTFDALAVEGRFSDEWSGRYAWIGRVHRVSGDEALDPLARERDMDTHLGEVAWKRGIQQVGGYAWLLDDQDVATASTATYGLRAVTDAVRDGRGWGLALELARQYDAAGNPLDFAHTYALVEPSYTVHGTTLRAGWERLGGDGTHALQTPLATLHAFNGWADKFLATPPAGLDDRYLGAGGKFAGKRFDWQLTWHDFRADAGDARYGREWDASLGFPVGRQVHGLAKLADYHADGFARDTTKAWLQFEWSH